MNFVDKIQNFFEEVWEGLARIFGPDDNEYPNSGPQPYEGDPNRENAGR